MPRMTKPEFEELVRKQEHAAALGNSINGRHSVCMSQEKFDKIIETLRPLYEDRECNCGDHYTLSDEDREAHDDPRKCWICAAEQRDNPQPPEAT